MTHQEPFVPGAYFHVYNRAVGNELLFYQDRNYRYFLEKYSQYISAYADMYSYCLLPNHFHLLLRIKDVFAASDSAEYKSGRSEIVARMFSHLFNAYAQALNKQVGRTGSLFQNRCKRIRITDEQYLMSLIMYIHTNPVHHGYTNNHEDWKYSSYHAVVCNKPTRMMRNEVISLFSSTDNFKSCHRDKKNQLTEKFCLE